MPYLLSTAVERKTQYPDNEVSSWVQRTLSSFGKLSLIFAVQYTSACSIMNATMLGVKIIQQGRLEFYQKEGLCHRHHSGRYACCNASMVMHCCPMSTKYVSANQELLQMATETS